MPSYIYDYYEEHDIYEHSMFPIIVIINFNRLNPQNIYYIILKLLKSQVAVSQIHI